MDRRYADVAKLIDHSLLKPTLTDEELDAGIALARDLGVASVCILPHALARCAELLADSGVQPSTTIGFPHGGHSTSVKVAEARDAVQAGGTELDMVVNIGKVLSGDYAYVKTEVAEVLAVARGALRKLKVIFEVCYLTDEHKRALCEICSELSVDWVKTSTGFGSGGATREDVSLLLDHTPPQVQVKASGGIRTLDQVLEYQALGATRVGSSATREILDEFTRRFGAGAQK
jgi:deoxyribose-phosphate aldolase